MIKVLIPTLILLCGCARDFSTYNKNTNSTPCTITRVGDGAVVVCPDGSKVHIADGAAGANGADGKDGLAGANGADGKDGLAGADGKDGLNGKDGLDGKDGLNGADGLDGKDGLNGADGSDGLNTVLLTKVKLPVNSCTKIYDGVWAEHIKTGNSYVFDVYYNSTCADAKGEYCDNVVPSDNATGKVQQYHGSGTLCVAGNLWIAGTLKDNNDIEISILDFN